MLVTILYVLTLFANKKIRIRNVKKIDIKNIMQKDKFLPEFEKLYYDLYFNNINEYEKIRKKLNCTNFIKFLFFLVFLIGEFSAVLNYNYSIVIMIIGLVGCLLLNAKISGKNKSYLSHFKKTIISEFVKLVDARLEYKDITNDQTTIRTLYEKANFDNREVNTFNSDDCITGNIDNGYIRIIDTHIQNITNGKSRNVEEIFNGLFVTMDSPKKYFFIC